MKKMKNIKSRRARRFPAFLDMTPMALLGAGGREQRGVGHLTGQWPAQAGTHQSF
jgi:hypothetical protein